LSDILTVSHEPLHCGHISKWDAAEENAHMRGRKKTVTRERSLTKATRKIRNILRRSIIVKLILAKNGTQVMRVLN
jgi:hypothetical protein